MFGLLLVKGRLCGRGGALALYSPVRGGHAGGTIDLGPQVADRPRRGEAQSGVDGP